MKIGDFEVLGELGRGGRGVVYRVMTPRGDTCALKVLQAEGTRLAVFDRERRLLSALGEADGFVGLLDAGRTSNGAWLLMPLIPGGTLRERLRRGALTVDETVALGAQLATALGRAHERGIVHRDVKPENVLFTASGRPLLADLGLARHFDRAAPGASQSVDVNEHGAFKGTAGYVAPEQVADPASAGPPADVFALGAVLYECVSGRAPFAGGTVFEMLARAASGTVEPLARTSVPDWLEEVIFKALAVDPAARYPDGASLALALERAERVPARRRPALLVAVVLGALLLAGGLLLGIPAPRGPLAAPPPPPPAPTLLPPAPSREDRARELVTHALSKIDAASYEEAIALATQAIELAPELALAWEARAMARSHLEDWHGSEVDMTRALELDPKKTVCWINRGHTRVVTGDLDGAIADMTRAIELDPASGAWADRGLARARKGDLEGGIADENCAVQLNPDMAWVWGRRGGLRLNKGDLEGGIADLEKALELGPDDPGAPGFRQMLAQAKKRLGR